MGLCALVIGRDFELNFLPFLQRLEALSLDHRIVDEHVGATFLLDESIPLLVVEPLHGTLCHCAITSSRPTPTQSNGNPKKRKAMKAEPASLSWLLRIDAQILSTTRTECRPTGRGLYHARTTRVKTFLRGIGLSTKRPLGVSTVFWQSCLHV